MFCKSSPTTQSGLFFHFLSVLGIKYTNKQPIQEPEPTSHEAIMGFLASIFRK